MKGRLVCRDEPPLVEGGTTVPVINFNPRRLILPLPFLNGKWQVGGGNTQAADWDRAKARSLVGGGN